MKHLSYDDGIVRAEIDIRPATTDDGIERGSKTYDIPAGDKHPFRAHSLFATLTAPSDILKLEVLVVVVIYIFVAVMLLIVLAVKTVLAVML